MLGLIVYPLVLVVLIWPFGPVALRAVVAFAAVMFLVSSAMVRRDPQADTMSPWENVWAAVGTLSIAVAIGGSLAAFILGPA